MSELEVVKCRSGKTLNVGAGSRVMSEREVVKCRSGKSLKIGAGSHSSAVC